MSSALDAQMIAAHEVDDKLALIRLYSQAADEANDIDACCFYLTHAYIFALDSGSPQTDALYAKLVAHGRES
jgi:hypothetical protein